MTCFTEIVTRRSPLHADTAGAVDALFAARGRLTTADRGQTLVMEEQPIESVYQISSGFVRCCSYTQEGQRQVFHFAGPGDLLGFPDLGIWHFSAEAVTDVVLRSIKIDVLEEAMTCNRAMQRELRRHCLEQIAARERHLVWLAYLRTEDRLLAFLEEFEAAGSKRGDMVELPMTRLDLADHLGMTFETVSRCFTALKRRGAIMMNGPNMYALSADEVSQEAA